MKKKASNVINGGFRNTTFLFAHDYVKDLLPVLFLPRLFFSKTKSSLWGILFVFLIFFSMGNEARALDLGLSYGDFSSSELSTSMIRERTWGLNLSFNWKRLDFIYNFNYFQSNESDDEFSDIERRYYDSLLWINYHFVQGSWVSLFLGVAGGAYIEKTTLSRVGFVFQSERGTSSPLWLVGTSVGLKIGPWRRFDGQLAYRINHRINEQTQSQGFNLTLSYKIY